jgi:hypothetical protein
VITCFPISNYYWGTTCSSEWTDLASLISTSSSPAPVTELIYTISPRVIGCFAMFKILYFTWVSDYKFLRQVSKSTYSISVNSWTVHDCFSLNNMSTNMAIVETTRSVGLFYAASFIVTTACPREKQRVSVLRGCLLVYHCWNECKWELIVAGIGILNCL